MKFYAYLGSQELGKEPLGTFGKMLFELKTRQGAKNRCRRIWGDKEFRLYTYTNFYNDSTFKEVK